MADEMVREFKGEETGDENDTKNERLIDNEEKFTRFIENKYNIGV